jgi:hypothetical protein
VLWLKELEITLLLQAAAEAGEGSIDSGDVNGAGAGAAAGSMSPIAPEDAALEQEGVRVKNRAIKTVHAGSSKVVKGLNGTNFRV